jgi:hypothetical protein
MVGILFGTATGIEGLRPHLVVRRTCVHPVNEIRIGRANAPTASMCVSEPLGT